MNCLKLARFRRYGLKIPGLIAAIILFGLIASAQTQHSVNLSWSESVSGVTFNVYRAQASSCTGMAMINLNPVTVTNYLDSNVTGGATYSYYVTAVGTGGESAPSNCVTVQIASPPPPPQGLTATAK